MEKHSAYCAMIRLGFDIPATVLVPYKNPVDHEKWAYTAETYNLPFDLDEVASRVGYPMFMKPFDGGAWRGVSRVDDVAALHRAYDESGQMLMHLQAAADYDSFARSLTIGPETKIMRFRPELPMHDRYEVSHDFLPPEAGMEILTLSRTINAFFRWEFNSCESLVTGTSVKPSTTPTPARTSPSPRCTTTSRGRSPNWCPGRCSARSPAGNRGWIPTPGPGSTSPTTRS